MTAILDGAPDRDRFVGPGTFLVMCVGQVLCAVASLPVVIYLTWKARRYGAQEGGGLDDPLDDDRPPR